MAIATAAKQVVIDRMDIVAAGGQDSDQPGPDARKCASAAILR